MTLTDEGRPKLLALLDTEAAQYNCFTVPLRQALATIDALRAEVRRFKEARATSEEVWAVASGANPQNQAPV